MTKKAIFARGDWDDVIERQEALAPRDGEMWVLNCRDSRTWSAMIEDQRIAHRMEQLTHNPLEIHKSDADKLQLEDGQSVRVRCAPDGASPGGEFLAVVSISDRMRPGVTSAYFNFRGQVVTAANNVVSNTPDPINGMYSFKLGRGVIEPA